MKFTSMFRLALMAPALFLATNAVAGKLTVQNSKPSVVNVVTTLQTGLSKQGSGKVTVSGGGSSARPVVTGPVIIKPKAGIGSVTNLGTGAVTIQAGNVNLGSTRTTTVNAAMLTNMVIATAANLVLTNATLSSGSSTSSGSSSSTGSAGTVIGGVLSGGTVITSPGGNAAVLNSALTNISGSLIKDGSGAVQITSNLVFTGDLVINNGSVNLMGIVQVATIRLGETASLTLGSALSVTNPLTVVGDINASDPGTAFASGNIADVSTPTGATFPNGTTIKVASVAGAVGTITNNSGSDLVITLSPTVAGAIVITKP
jgi:autotransporter-associated beta strand protein